MPTKVGTHDKLQRGGICCGFSMRREDVLYCALSWIPASAGMTVEKSNQDLSDDVMAAEAAMTSKFQAGMTGVGSALSPSPSPH